MPSTGSSRWASPKPKPIENLMFERVPTSDHRWIGETHECMVCQSDLFLMLASFSEGKVAQYVTTGMCAMCGALLSLPTEVGK